MQINITVNLTREEVLAAITEKIREESRYTRWPVQPGEALHLEEAKDGYFVEWGEKPIEPKPVEQLPAVEDKPAPPQALVEVIEAAQVMVDRDDRRQPGEPAMF
jgi:hypothetical protein